MVSNEKYGIDERVVFHQDKIKFDNITSSIMLKIYEKSEQIAFFESTNISIDDKLYEIDNRNVPQPVNFFNGGLFNDWEFDFFVQV